MCSSFICDFWLLNIYWIQQNSNAYKILNCTILSVPFCPYHYVQYHFVRIPFCPYHFVRTILSPTILSGHPSRPTVKLSTLWLTRQKIGCSPPLFAARTTFSARSSPYPHQTAWPPQTSSSICPTLKIRQAMYSPCLIQSVASSCPVLGLFSPSVLLYTLFPQQLSQSLSLFIYCF